MVELVQDGNGKVIGVIAQDKNDDHYIRINASKGIIVAAGGYATNTDMMLALQPMTMEMKVNVPIGSTADGSGIKAMLWAGGKMDPCHASMMFNRASCLPTETAGYKTNGKWFWFGEQPFLKVNLEGKRFCNESGPYEFMLHSMYLQPSHTYCDIFDANAKQYAEQFDEVGCCRLTPVDTAPFYGIRTCAWHLTTLDGVRINTDMQVLREDGTVIEGLYATGDCTGGFFANNYPNLFTGLACGRTMTFGRRAAKIVAKL